LGDITVVAEARMVCGVNTQTHAIAWQVAPGHSVNERGGATANNGRRVFRQINGGRLIIQGNGRVIINGQLINAGDVQELEGQGMQPADPEIARQVAFARLGRPTFSTMRMIGDKLVIIANGAMSAIDIATGKPAWTDATGGALSVKLPAGVSNLVTGNEELVVAEVNAPDRDASSFFVVDAETGKFRKQITLDNEHAQWRTVGDDGTLYVVGEQAVSAYDLFADQDQPLWRRSDIQSRFPAATALTLDGLVLVNSNSEVECLSLEGGEVRWPTTAWGPMRIEIPEPTWLRSKVEGDEVIFQAPQGVVAYASAVQDSAEKQRAWRGSINVGQTPPLDSVQVSEPYVVALAMGPTNAGAQRAVSLFFLARKGGALHLIQPIQRTPNAADPEGPLINAWEVVDNGIAMEVGGAVYFYHGKAPG
jgi:outer membrane protein assembly factor BamB